MSTPGCQRVADPAAAAPAQRHKLVDVLRRFGPVLAAITSLSAGQRRLLDDAERCRTAALGGRLLHCEHCGEQVPLYNSCRNRNCPNCQAIEQHRWIEARSERILPVGHHHVVLTVPSQLRPLFRHNPRPMLKLLQDAVRKTLLELCEQRHGVVPGVTAVLHTWTRELALHPHVHCIVTAGGLSLDGERWVELRRFLLPVALLRATFRANLIEGLNRLLDAGTITLPLHGDTTAELARCRLFKSLPRPGKWVVHVQRPFGRSNHVLQYLGRYTHRIAISDQRLVSVSDDAVVFRTRNEQTLSLRPVEFVRRFIQHVLPKGLNKIRHFGLYAPASVGKRLATARRLLGAGDAEPTAPATSTVPAQAHAAAGAGAQVCDDAGDANAAARTSAAELLAALTGIDPLRCPKCAHSPMRVIPVVPLARARSRGPP